jgi:hypothetical protein
MTLNELIEMLQSQSNLSGDLQVILEIDIGENDNVTTFINSTTTIYRRGNQQTYLGDMDIVQIKINQDEP